MVLCDPTRPSDYLVVNRIAASLSGQRCIRADGLPTLALRRWLRTRIRRGVPGSGLNGGSSRPAFLVGGVNPPSEECDPD